MLYAPTARTIAFDTPRYLVWLPFGSTTFDLQMIDQRPNRTRVRAGTAWLFGPGRAVGLKADEPIELLALAVDPKRLNKIATSVAGDRAWRERDVMDITDPGIEGIALEVRRTLLNERVPDVTYLQALVDAILARLACHLTLRLTEPKGTETITSSRLDRVLKHIDEQLDEPLRVEQLAEMVGLSRSHFSRAFQRMTGHSPQRFIINRRLCKARTLLLTSTANLAQIAAQSGFSSHAHMTAVFRKELGVTPSRCRAAEAEER